MFRQIKSSANRGIRVHRLKLSSIIIFLIWLSPFYITEQADAQKVYKYKDKTGNWVFGDKPPEDNQITAKSFELQSSNTKKPSVTVKQSKNNGAYSVVVNNPLHTEIHIQLVSRSKPRRILYSEVVAKTSEKTLYRGKDKLKYRYRWSVGEMNSPHDPCCWSLPFSHYKQLVISQGFNGKYSHQSPRSKYAVDIAMPMGTNILAAKGGTVFQVRDGFALSGRSKYFLDKSNSIKIAHEDGSYSLYVHLLEGSLRVKEGDQVVQGQIIAQSGNSGYSTGPHLHFAVMRNRNMNVISVPFKFLNSDTNQIFTPEKGMSLQNVGTKEPRR